MEKKSLLKWIGAVLLCLSLLPLSLLALGKGAKDAFRFDHSDLFYVDFDKMSISKTMAGYFMGVGREETYLRDGFYGENAVNIAEAIAALAQASGYNYTVTATMDGQAKHISYEMDVNMTGLVDAADAQQVYNLYNATYYSFDTVSMEKFLRGCFIELPWPG